MMRKMFEKIFKKESKKVSEKTWNDITLEQWYKINDILEVQDEWTIYNLIDYIYDVDSTELPLHEISKYSIDFLQTPIENVECNVKKLVFNDREYEGFFDLTRITAAQFVDYQNYMKEDKIKYEKLLSVFIIPKGKKYNSGYSLSLVQEDILKMPITLVHKISFFFQKQFQVCAKISLYSLRGEITNMNLGEKKDKMIEVLDKAILADLV